MAERRMFAKTIVLSDAFLDMSLGARCLYMTLGMVADDDGFVNNPKSIMRQCGASEDDLRVLLAKKFLLAFDSGVIVIKHWRINNYLRNDRYQGTKYVDEKALLTIDEVGSYHRDGESGIPPGIPGIPNAVYPGKDRLGKDRIGKDSIEDTIVCESSAIETAFEEFWAAYPKKVGKKDAFKAFQKVHAAERHLLVPAVEMQKQSRQWQAEGGRFIPNPSTWLNQGRWLDEPQKEEPERKPAADQKPVKPNQVVASMKYNWSDMDDLLAGLDNI